MKTFFKTALMALSCLCASCGEDSVIRQTYCLKLPSLPETWLEVMGEASWHIEWIGEDGGIHSAEIYPSGGNVSAEIMQNWASPVSAWPYWPEKGVRHGVMKPAGAIFPFDTDGANIRLSWNAGVDAVFFGELAALGNEKRLPHNFNWRRFRELFSNAELPEDVLADPWLADWKSIAAKTAASGFDRRRINAQKLSSRSLTIPADGPWIGVSPFADSKDWQKGETVTIKLGSGVESYFSPEGVLRCSSNAWNWLRHAHNQ
ncbi:MAG: hypothetical protein LBH18_07975 [Spirochaetaceae bacterium]|jgi:hypothetical protein|nr:hypothetical protein [Spirochaetaceae bacterium]